MEVLVQVLVPGADFAREVPGTNGRPLLSGAFDFTGFGLRPSLDNCRIVSVYEVCDLDIDLAMIAGASVRRSMLRHLLPIFGRRRPVCLGWFCSNERPCYRWDLMHKPALRRRARLVHLGRTHSQFSALLPLDRLRPVFLAGPLGHAPQGHLHRRLLQALSRGGRPGCGHRRGPGGRRP